MSLKRVFIIKEGTGKMSLQQLARAFPDAYAAWIDFENNERAEMGDEYEPADVSFEKSPEGQILAFVSDGVHTTADPWLFQGGEWVYPY